jgi:hypothetical protein
MTRVVELAGKHDKTHHRGVTVSGMWREARMWWRKQ